MRDEAVGGVDLVLAGSIHWPTGITALRGLVRRTTRRWAELMTHRKILGRYWTRRLLGLFLRPNWATRRRSRAVYEVGENNRLLVLL